MLQKQKVGLKIGKTKKKYFQLITFCVKIVWRSKKLCMVKVKARQQIVGVVHGENF